MNKTTWTPEMDDKVRSMIEQGHSMPRIGEAIGVSKSAICRRANKLGIIVDRGLATEHVDRLALEYFMRRIGKAAASLSGIASTLKVPRHKLESSIHRLHREGKLIRKGMGEAGYWIIPGHGETKPRKVRNTVIARIVDNVPEPVNNFTCGRCGARNCQTHGETSVTVAMGRWKWAA